MDGSPQLTEKGLSRRGTPPVRQAALTGMSLAVREGVTAAPGTFGGNRYHRPTLVSRAGDLTRADRSLAGQPSLSTVLRSVCASWSFLAGVLVALSCWTQALIPLCCII